MFIVKEIFYSLQGEGLNSGRAAVFCRFAGCNLWSGRESERQNAICKFCDTDFNGMDGKFGGKYTTSVELADEIEREWIPYCNPKDERFVVLTGGEPLLQLNDELVEELHKRQFEIAIETNGTILPPLGVDWICVSPKARAPLKLIKGDELKFVFPQQGLQPDDVKDLDFNYFFVQPMDGPNCEKNTQLAISYCLANPQWRLSLQTHKKLGLK